MNRAEFDARYRLGDRIAEGAVLSYRAHDLAADQEVRIHLLAGTTADEAAHLRDLLLGLEPHDRALILAETDVEGIGVVVTGALPGFTTLPSWLESRASSAAPAPERSAPGEFTRLFGAVPPEPQSGGGSPPPRAEPIPRREFTPPLVPADPAPSPRPVIRLGGSSSPPRGPAPPPPLQPPDLSRRTDERPLFASQIGSGASGPLWAAPLGDPSAIPPVTPAPLRGPADIADLIAAAGGRSSSDRRPEPSPTVSDTASAATPEEPPGRSYLPLVVILAALLLCAIGWVVYFALKTP
jgi:hypothetical protein